MIDIVDSLAQHVDPKAPKTMARKPGAKVPAVRTPHAGQSYNPTFEDHVDAMQLVITKVCCVRFSAAAYGQRMYFGVSRRDAQFWGIHSSTHGVAIMDSRIIQV